SRVRVADRRAPPGAGPAAAHRASGGGAGRLHPRRGSGRIAQGIAGGAGPLAAAGMAADTLVEMRLGPRSNLRYHVLLALVAAVWGGAFVAIRRLDASVSPATITLIRFVLT